MELKFLLGIESVIVSYTDEAAVKVGKQKFDEIDDED